MNIVLLGPQGSGKGTQADLLVQKYGLIHYEAGKILRSIALSDNPHSLRVKQALESGNLVPDELVRLIAWDFINKHDRNKGFIFDGYPRSIAQFDHLEDMLCKFGKKIDLVLNIEISREESIRRLAARRTCEKCGEVYSLILNPPASDKCKCGGALIQRSDDTPEAISHRLDIYRDSTHPVFLKAVRQGVGYEINGERPITEIHQSIVSIINKTRGDQT